MKPHGEPGFTMTERHWQILILILAAGVLFITVWCLMHGITTIFMHLYYFPIVLLAYHYRWRGCWIATVLALAYAGLVVLFEPETPDVVLGALYRVLAFVGIAAVVAYLSERLATETRAADESAEIRERYISLAPAIILVLDRQGTITYLNPKGGEILECTPGEVVGKSWFDQFLPEKDREPVRRVFTGLMAGQAEPGRALENRVLTCGGTEKVIRWHNTLLHDKSRAISGTLAYGEDITEEKWAQDALRELQQFQENVITNANVWISVLAPDGTLLVWNEAAEAISGYRKDEVLGKKSVWKQMYPDPAYRKKVTGEIQRIIGQDTILENFETEIRCADTTTKTIVWNTRGMRDNKGMVTGYIAIGRDVTAQRAAELRAGESSRFLAAMIDTLPMPIFFKDTAGKYLGCNPPFEEYIGIKRENLAGKTVYDLSPKDLADKYAAADQQLFDNPVPQRYETQVQYADGMRHDVIFYKAPFFNSDGTLGGLIGAFLDITDRKQAEEALRESEEKFRGLFTRMNEGNALHRMVYDGAGNPVEYQILDVNPAFERILGLKRENVIGRTAREAYSSDAPPFLDMYSRVTSSGNPESTEVYFAPLKKHFALSVYSTGGGTFATIFSDITKRKEAEELLQKGQAQLATAMDLARLANWEFDVATGIFTFNDRFYAMYDTTAEREGGYQMPADVYAREFVHPEDAGMVAQEVQKAIETTDPRFISQAEHRIIRRDGAVRHIVVRFSVTKDAAGRTVKTHGANQDITDRKLAEEALRRTNIILLTQQETSPDGILIVDENGSILSYNHRFLEIWMIPPEMVASRNDGPVLAFVKDRTLDPEGFVARVNYLYEHREEASREEVRLKDGTVLERYSAPMLGADHRYFGRVWYFHDITGIKNAERALRESRQLFSDIISFLPDPTFVIDQNGVILAWNRAIEQFSGVHASDMIGKGEYEYSLWSYGKRRPILIDLVLHPDLDAARLNYTGLYQEGRTVTAQTEITRPGSNKKTALSLVASPLVDEDGSVTGAIESMRDITHIRETETELARINASLEMIVRERTQKLEEEVAQRIQAEKDVQSALDYTRSVIEANPDLVVVLDETGVILDVNAAGELLTGISKEDLIGTPYFGYLVEDGTVQSAFAGLLQEGTIENFVQIRHTDGHVTPLSVHATVVRGWKGGKDRIIVSAHDITRQKKDEETLRAALDEQVLLLREVHHRVKNNLQIIISLVNLQMRQTNDPAVKQIMSETQNRVRAMSLVHEKLYRSTSLSRIDFADYTRFLATQLFSFYGTDTRRVRLDFTMTKTMVDINTSVPLGLLMNELISNALKHAFPNGREGVISISGGEAGDLITLVIHDNGVGMSKDLDWKNTTTLGMRLVTSLVDQIDGSIALDRENGTMFTITVMRPPASGGTG